ncbi:MAG: AAA family ATPase [Gemmataceae bacterium]
MIPIRICLRGFLSFRDERTLSFDRDRILLLSVPNGAGKSTVFDAVVFALYGGHRGGQRDALELLNKDSDTAVVQFDFLLDGETYRAERAIKKKVDRKTGEAKGETKTQLHEHRDGKWKAIEGTDKVGGFKEWVGEHIGLSFDAFTSSVLLMQGRAEALVEQDDDAAKRRFSALARIVGLDFYQQLHKRVDTLRLKLQRDADQLSARLDGIPAVAPEDLEKLSQEITAKDEESKKAAQDGAAWQKRKERATEWTKLLADLAAAKRDCDAADALLGDAPRIEEDGRRLAELDAVVPPLTRLLEQRKVAAEAVKEKTRLEADGAAHLKQGQELTSRLQEIQQKLAAGEQQHDERDRKRQELDQKEREFSQALPWLRRIADGRDQLRHAREVLAELTARAALADAAVVDHEKNLTPHAEQLQSAEAELDAARHAVTQAQTQLTVIRTKAERFNCVAGEKNCSYCGQELKPEHIEQEKADIARDLADRERDLASATDRRQKAIAERDDCAKRHTEATTALAEARRVAEQLRRDTDGATESASRLARAVGEAYAELIPRMRAKVSPEPPADWLATTFPTPEDLAKAGRCVADWGAQLVTLKNDAEAWKTESARLTKEKKRLEQDAVILQGKASGITAAIQVEHTKIDLASRQLTAIRDALPEPWRPHADGLDDAGLRRFQVERLELRERRASERWQELQAARASHGHLHDRWRKLDASRVDFAEEDRRSPETVQPELDAARQRERDLSQAKARLEKTREDFITQREKRAKIEDESRAAEKRRQVAERLANLLGPKQLQRHLLHQAEVAIVENANHVLDKLAAGQLYLRLLPDDENEKCRALQLDTLKPASGQSFGLAFLSGSEKFRVAISLALGIGQYASRQHRPIESVIIDEGFGCLDRDNRRTMIDELAELRGQLRCILLVSHQEEFADAFPDGYRFNIADGTTQVTPA